MIAWGIETLVATTLLMLVVLVVRAPVRRLFGPNIAYALWALPVLRMVLPPLPDTIREGSTPLAQASDTFAYYVVEPLGVLPVADGGAEASLWPYVLAAWALGAATFALFHLVRYGRFCARVRRDAAAGTILADGRVAVVATDAATGPLAFGVWRKYVAFPRDFAERYDPLERDLALAHELGHHARGDLVANWVALVVLALHWFNPIAWRAFRAFRADQEMACDALVLAGRADALRHAYGRAIVKSAHGGTVSAACHLNAVHEVKRRLRMLGKHRRASRRQMAGGAAAVAALTIVGLGGTASGTAAAERVRSTVETATGVDIASLEMPQLPQAPPVPAAPPASTAPTTTPEPSTAPAAGKPTRVHIIRRDKDGTVEQIVSDEGDGQVHPARRHRYVVRVKDGRAVAWSDGAELRSDTMPVPPLPPVVHIRPPSPEALAALKAMPEMMSRDCAAGEGKDGETVIRRSEGGKRVIIYCQNRFRQLAERAAESASRHAELSERFAMASALSGLRRARASIERNTAMDEQQRSSALAGIDQAIREVEQRPAK